MLVRNWMSRPVISVGPEDPVETAREVMERHRLRRLPVLLGGRLVGIVTLSDIQSEVGRCASIAWHEGSGPVQPSVGDVMTPDPVQVGPEDPIEGAAFKLLERRISGLPVVEGNEVVGMITETDIFRAFAEMLGVHEPGARVVVALPSLDDVVPALKKASHGLHIRALATFQDRGTKAWRLLVKLRGRRKAQFKAARTAR